MKELLNKIDLSSLFSQGLRLTIGMRFKDICIVGLNRVEYLPERGEETFFGESWQDVTDEQSRKNLTLLFFAPRELDGDPVNPYTFLAGEDSDDSEGIAMVEQAVVGMPLLDYCRTPPAEANVVNIIVAADVVFHWDINDSYILPTTQFNWVQDLQNIIKSYPRTTNFNLYTNWSTEKLSEIDINIFPIQQLPLEEHTWVNMPTFQEKYGTFVLTISLVIAALAYGLLQLKQSEIDHISEQIRIVQQQIPRESAFSGFRQSILEQEKYMKYRTIFPLLVKDAARTIQLSNMKIENFEVSNPKPLEPSNTYLLTIEAERDAYKGWLQEEPVAKSILANSATLNAIRKPPGNIFKLEGLIDLQDIYKEYQQAQKNIRPTGLVIQRENEQNTQRAEGEGS